VVEPTESLNTALPPAALLCYALPRSRKPRDLGHPAKERVAPDEALVDPGPDHGDHLQHRVGKWP
jgi:hypothetical protein